MFADIEGQLQSLTENRGPRQLPDQVQDDEKISGLLEDLRETIFDYQVRS